MQFGPSAIDDSTRKQTMEPEGGMNDSPVMLAEPAVTVTNPTMSAAGDVNLPATITASAASDKPAEKKRALGRGLESLISAARSVPSAHPATHPGELAPANGGATSAEPGVGATGVTIAAVAEPAPD